MTFSEFYSELIEKKEVVVPLSFYGTMMDKLNFDGFGFYVELNDPYHLVFRLF